MCLGILVCLRLACGPVKDRTKLWRLAMRDEYNIRELNPRKNLYTSKVKVTIDVEGSTLDYFKSMAAVDGILYQTLINLYLRDCADNRRKIQMSWQ